MPGASQLNVQVGQTLLRVGQTLLSVRSCSPSMFWHRQKLSVPPSHRGVAKHGRRDQISHCLLKSRMPQRGGYWDERFPGESSSVDATASFLRQSAISVDKSSISAEVSG